jgi:hypothetical protein
MSGRPFLDELLVEWVPRVLAEETKRHLRISVEIARSVDARGNGDAEAHYLGVVSDHPQGKGRSGVESTP